MKNQIRRIFDVYVNKNTYGVFDVPEKLHGLDGSTWWVYLGKLPEGSLPDPEDGALEPFCRSINCAVWEISVRQNTYTKYKWGGINFRASGAVEMKCNGKMVYEFSFGSGDGALGYAMAKAQMLTVQLAENPGFDFLNPMSNQGRKVHWYGLPAAVRVNPYETWNIGIVPDYTEGLDKAAWWEELKRRKTNLPLPDKTDNFDDCFNSHEEEHTSEAMQDDYINWGDALSDQHINWFRS